MWNQKQNNENFSGRVMGPFVSQASDNRNSKIVPYTDVSERDFLTESSRKRKAVAMEYSGNTTSDAICQPVLIKHWANKSNHQCEFGTLSSLNMSGSTMRGFPKLTPSLESGVKMFLSGRYESEGLNSYSPNLHTNEKNNPPDVVTEKMDNLHSSTRSQDFHQRGPPHLIKSSPRNIPNIPDPQSITHYVFMQTKVHKPYPDPADTGTKKAFSGHGSVDGRNFGCIEMKQNGQNLDEAKTVGVPIARPSSMETAFFEGNVKEQSFQHHNSEARTGSPINNCSISQLIVRDQNDGNRDSQVMEGKEGTIMENGNHSLGEGVSPINADNPTYVLPRHGLGDDSQHVARKSDGNSKTHAEKIATITEKLWEGSLQLSASVVTVSAVAFFKSGEKAPEVKWSKSIVVKGKVRLEAFERFIQELPRSRSRGLMVTSLCWRAGSSETGLASMKEVAKTYKEEDKVGFAQLSRGIDLYVCPRSDAIITILAKYGFFKGMAALEEDQDSLIGCVVWRRNQPPSDLVIKKSKNQILPLSEQPVLTSNPIVSQSEKDNSRATPSGERYSPLLSKNCSAPHKKIPGTSTESKSTQLGEVQIELGISTTNPTPEINHLAPHSSPAISDGLKPAIPSIPCSLNSHMTQKVDTMATRSSEAEELRASLEFPRPVSALSSHTATAQTRLDPDDEDDDDLPEFDFGIACGLSQHLVGKSLSTGTSAHVSDAVSLGMKAPAEGAKSVCGPTPSALHAVPPAVIASHQRSQPMTSPDVSAFNESNNPAKRFGEGGSFTPVLPYSDEKPMVHGNEQSGQPIIVGPPTSKALSTPKSLWDDDDDMPEWCPPDLEHQSQPTMASTTRTSNPCPPSPPFNPNSDNKLSCPPPTLPTTMPSRSYIPSPFPNLKYENIPPPRMATSRHLSSYMPSPVPNQQSETMPPGPLQRMETLRPSSSYLSSPAPHPKSENTPPGPPQTVETLKTSSFTQSPVPNRESANILPEPPLPPPPPLSIRSQFHTQGLSHSHQSSIKPRPVRVQAPVAANTLTGFTYNPLPKPKGNVIDTRPPHRPAGWRGQ